MANEIAGLTVLDRNWIKLGLQMTEASIKRKLDGKDVTPAVKEALEKDLKSLRETITRVQ